MLKVERVRHDNVMLFTQYAAAHGREHDSSYLPGTGLTPSRQHPSYVLLQGGNAVGAVSLMRTPRYLRARRGRYSIFHATNPSVQNYSLLFNAIRRHFRGLHSTYLFLPEGRKEAAAALCQLGFTIERYAYVMKIDRPAPTGMVVPDGLALQAIRPGERRSYDLFARAINESFNGLAGHIPTRADFVQGLMGEDTYLEDGIALLLRGRQVAGTVCVMRDSEDRDAGDISGLSVARDFRHQGLGRLLLRHAVCFAAWQGLWPVFLSLNAENKAALRLYQSEGFVVTDTMVCYSRDCSP